MAHGRRKGKGHSHNVLIILLAVLACLLVAIASAADEPFGGPANWGMTGLMEMPTARVLKEDSYRMGAAQVHPYRYYYGAVGLFKGLEINGRVTEIIGVKALSADYGNYKDKAIDLKHRFWEEGKYSPALAVGIMDPHGTNLYGGQFIVASKQVYPFDFTIGFGNGRMGKRPLGDSGNDLFRADIFTDPGQWLKDGQIFGGIQFSPSEKYSLMVEYNPTLYHRQKSDPAQPKYFRRAVPLKYNFGFRWKPLEWAEVDLTYQRGNEIGLSVSMNFDIGRPLVPIYDKPYREKPEDSLNSPHERIEKALRALGFSDIGVADEAGTLLIRAQNDKYFYSMRALGVILRSVAAYVPDSVNRIRVTLTKIGVPMFEAVTTRADVQDFYTDRPGLKSFYLSEFNTDIIEAPAISTKNRRVITPGWKPSFQTLLNDPSGFFKYRLGLEGWIGYHPWKGSSFVASLEAYPINNISTSIIPPAEAVRSDIFEYKKQGVGLGRLMVDQVYKTKGDVYTRFAAGLLEIEYAGVDGEVAVPLANGRFLVGLQASIVKKRDPGNPFKLKEHDAKDYYHVEFLNTRLNIPEKNLAIQLKTGRFLGGDIGTRVTVEKYIKGVTLLAWYSFTDTSLFSDRFNRGYHDAGIGVVIPMRLFEGVDTRTAYSYTLSPWTRDVAQDIYRYQNLFNFIGRDTKVWLYKDRKLAQ